MLGGTTLGTTALDVPTLFFVAVCISALLGLFLIFAWLQERDTRALAWWGSAYLLGASSLAFWNTPAPLFPWPLHISGALMFMACGMIWNGVRLFHGRRPLALPIFAGSAAWLLFSQLPSFSREGTQAMFGSIIIALYTFSIAFELWRERRKSLRSRVAGLAVPLLHEAMFLMPIAMKVALPENLGHGWLQVLALETMIYAIGTAFLVLIMVKDHQVVVQRTAASTDSLTGLLNRRAFIAAAQTLCAKQTKARAQVTLMMFDLDHFKSINDRFGHATGDEALRVFARSVAASLRVEDVIGRLGGEEFAAILDASSDDSEKIAERVRAGFEAAGVEIAGHSIGATVSIGTASAWAKVATLDALLSRADEALYTAKKTGRNRAAAAPFMAEPDMPAAPAAVPAETRRPVARQVRAAATA